MSASDAERLRAGLDEDEAAIGTGPDPGGYCDALEGIHLSRERAGREVEAKRYILNLCETETWETGGKPLALRILHALAAVYTGDSPSLDPGSPAGG